MDGLAFEYAKDPTRLRRGVLPRLTHIRCRLDDIVQDLTREASVLSDAVTSHIRHAPGGPKLIQSEELVCRAVCVLVQARQAMKKMYSMEQIPRVMPVIVSEVRATSASLYGAYPTYSAALYGLASEMGAVLVDSASISGARIDFGRSNAESSRHLDEAKLIVRSKSNKLRPNQPIPAVSGTWNY